MKQSELQRKVYGDVPQSFEHRVQYALHNNTQKQKQPIRRMPLRTALIVLMLLALAGAACAAVLSRTADWFGAFYGQAWKDAALSGDVDQSHPTARLGDVTYSLDDVIVTGITLGEGGMTVSENDCRYILATGTIRPAPGANVVLIPEDYELDEPWSLDSNGATVLEQAEAQGAKILCVRVTANGLITAGGQPFTWTDDAGRTRCPDIGYDEMMQEDGSILFSMEIVLDESVLARQDAYTLSVYIANHEVSREGEHLMDTRVSEDWVFDIHPVR